MSDSEFDVIDMDDPIGTLTQDGEEAKSTALQNEPADRTAVSPGDLSSDELEASSSQTYAEEWIKFEELLQSLHTSVAHLGNFVKLEKIAKIDMTTENQIGNWKNTAEIINQNESDVDCRSASGLQKEMMILKAELLAKDDKIKTLETVLECRNNGIPTAAEATPSEKKMEVTELQERVIRLEAKLSAKQEQIATLKTTLKSENIRVEAALIDLKSKYENEKTIVDETMLKLRNELRMLKESAETFSSREDEWKRELAVAEQDRKTLNLLIHLTVQQKLALTLRLEEMEAANQEARCRKRQ